MKTTNGTRNALERDMGEDAQVRNNRGEAQAELGGGSVRESQKEFHVPFKFLVSYANFCF